MEMLWERFEKIRGKVNKPKPSINQAKSKYFTEPKKVSLSPQIETQTLVKKPEIKTTSLADQLKMINE